jgi:hypothetical protein
VLPALRLLFQSLSTSLLDLLDLADHQGEPRDVALQFGCDRPIGWTLNFSSGGSRGCGVANGAIAARCRTDDC